MFGVEYSEKHLQFDIPQLEVRPSSVCMDSTPATDLSEPMEVRDAVNVMSWAHFLDSAELY